MWMGPARGGSKAMAMRAAAEDQSKVGLIESSASSASDPLALLEDLGEDVKASAHSEIMLLRSLLANNKVDPDSFRERTQGAWEMIGVVSALFLTMDRYTEVVECDPEEDWGLNPHLCIVPAPHPKPAVGTSLSEDGIGDIIDFIYPDQICARRVPGRLDGHPNVVGRVSADVFHP